MITCEASKADANRTGPLRHVLENAATIGRYSMKELTVLAVQQDPYRLDTPAGHRDAAWLAKTIACSEVQKPSICEAFTIDWLLLIPAARWSS